MLKFTDKKREAIEKFNAELKKRFCGSLDQSSSDQNIYVESTTQHNKNDHSIHEPHKDNIEDEDYTMNENETEEDDEGDYEDDRQEEDHSDSDFEITDSDSEFGTSDTESTHDNVAYMEGAGKAFPFNRVLYQEGGLKIVVKREQIRDLKRFKMHDHQYIITAEFDGEEDKSPKLTSSLDVVFEGLKEIIEELKQFYSPDLNRIFKLCFYEKSLER